MFAEETLEWREWDRLKRPDSLFVPFESRLEGLEGGLSLLVGRGGFELELGVVAVEALEDVRRREKRFVKEW